MICVRYTFAPPVFRLRKLNTSVSGHPISLKNALHLASPSETHNITKKKRKRKKGKTRKNHFKRN